MLPLGHGSGPCSVASLVVCGVVPLSVCVCVSIMPDQYVFAAACLALHQTSLGVSALSGRKSRDRPGPCSKQV